MKYEMQLRTMIGNKNTKYEYLYEIREIRMQIKIRRRMWIRIRNMKIQIRIKIRIRMRVKNMNYEILVWIQV